MIFYLENKKGRRIASFKYLGTGESSHEDNEILLLKDSLIAKQEHKTKKWIRRSYISDKREEIINMSSTIRYDDDYYQVKKDIVINSPNLAACVVLGRITTKAWHEMFNDHGKTLHEVYRETQPHQ